MSRLLSGFSNQDSVELVKQGKMEHRIRPIHLWSPDLRRRQQSKCRGERVVFSIKI